MGITHFPNGVSSFGLPVLPGVGTGAYSGNTFFVDSGSGLNANPGTFQKPFATIDYAVGKCTASNGDVIYVKEGHTETVTAVGGLDLDIAGITIFFMGTGNGRGSINFTTLTGADMDVDAADITLINPRFVAGIDALTGPIDVNSARFKMINATWQDGTTINTTDCLVADANADDMVIDGFEFIDGDAAGTQKQSFIQIAGATRPVLKRIRCTGDFGTGIIENGTAWVDAYLEDVVIDNASTSPTVGILLQATSSGQARNCHIRVASGTTYVTADNDMQFFECFGTGTDATAGEKIGTILAGDLEAKIDIIDEFHDVPAANNVLNAQINEVIGNKEDTAATGAVTTTDTLIAYIKQLVTQNGAELDTDTLGALLAGTNGIATIPSAAVPANNVNVFELLRSLWGNQCGTAAGENGIATFPSAAAAANNVSLAEVIRYISENQSTRIAVKTYADLTGYDTASAFTVTGDVLVNVWGVVGATGITSTSGTTTLSVGTTEAAQAIIANSTVNNTQFAATDVWVDSSPSDDAETLAERRVVIGGGAAIVLTRSVDDLTAGTLTLYCEWKPLSSDGNVVAA